MGSGSDGNFADSDSEVDGEDAATCSGRGELVACMLGPVGRTAAGGIASKPALVPAVKS